MEKLFLRFHPEEKVLAAEFARKLPDSKLSMAALQEHLMTFRKDPVKAVAETKSVLKAMEEVAEFPITEWLLRLNLAKYIPKFAKKQILFVSDIRKWCKDDALNDDPEAKLFIFREDEQHDVARINAMLDPKDENSKSDFRWLNTGRAYKMIGNFVKNLA